MVKILWAVIGLNTLALLAFLLAFLVLSGGRHLSYEEKGWTTVLSLAGLVFILLAAVPLYLNQSTGTQIFSGIFAFLPAILIVTFSVIK